MSSRSRRHFLNQAAILTASLCGPIRARCHDESRGSQSERTIVGDQVAATVHPVASHAATRMLELGGSAIDAAIAAALCLSVVDGHNSGIGGGCLLLIRSSDGKLHALDGRETAPAAINPSMYIRDGKPDVQLSQDGPLACGVPGLLKCLSSAHQRFGKLAWADLFEPAIRAARDGCIVSTSTANTIAAELKVIKQFPASRAVLLKSDGSPYKKGETLIQLDLANTLEKIAKHGVDWFYEDEFAKRCTEHVQSLGGVLSRDDFREYRTVDRTPLITEYRSKKIVGFPPPSSGGLHILQMLQILQRFPLRDLSKRSIPFQFYHLLAESMKLAFADRAFYLGDSDFVDIPKHLISVAYTDQLADTIDLEHANRVRGHFQSPAADIDDQKKHTTHLSVADNKGNWVALTATVNTSWGNKMIVPGTGVVLNDQMDDFSIAPGVPNAFGLIGSHANSVEPRKRPLSSMSPTLVLDSEGRPEMTCGAAGGPRIITATLQNLIHCIDTDKSIGEAIDASRLHHQWAPNFLSSEAMLGQLFERLGTEQVISNPLIESLKKGGHDVRIVSSLAVAQGIQVRAHSIDGTPPMLMAACDPRAEGKATKA